MPEPEILRRCPVCGASSRPGALFCPQCGNAARKLGSSSEAAEMAHTEALPEPPLDPKLQTRKLEPPQDLESARKLGSSRKLESPQPRARPRMGKLRKASTVVLDEAAYDPSIRFVLVAAVLFGLFLVLLILSKVIT